MIQRIQSVYLLIAALITALMFFFPFADYLKDGIIYRLDVLGLINTLDETVIFTMIPVLLLITITLIISIVAIFAYKNRVLQIRLCSLNLLLYLILIAGIFYYTDSAESFLGKEGLVTSFSIGVVFPLIALILTFMANRAIKKDEALVRSADRIR